MVRSDTYHWSDYWNVFVVILGNTSSGLLEEKIITGMNPKATSFVRLGRTTDVKSSGISFPQQAAGNQTHRLSPSRLRRAGA